MGRPRSVRKLLVITSSLMLAVAAGAPRAYATDGDLDPTFGHGGNVTTVFPGGSRATAVAMQADGKIVVVGEAAGSTGTGEFAVGRYRRNGMLDASFGDGGIVTTPIRGGNDEARSVAIQGNGRIVVAGTDSGERFALARYRTDGTLDTSFGGDGIVRTNFAPGFDVAWDVAIQRDGKIVAVGAAGFGQTGFRLARYRSDGSLDPTFGDGGKVMTRYHGANARAVVLQPNGRIVVAGYQPGGLAIARYLPDGRLDRSFSGNGLLGDQTHGGCVVWALDVALQTDGRIVVAGAYDVGAFGLARFNPDGRIDRTFGGDGVVRETVPGGFEQGASGLVIQADGRIVATGTAGPHESASTDISHFVLIRRLADGHRDRSFGTGGEVATFIGSGAGAAGSAADLQGRIVVVGQADTKAGIGFAVARYLA